MDSIPLKYSSTAPMAIAHAISYEMMSVACGIAQRLGEHLRRCIGEELNEKWRASHGGK
jgi:hypothetical protein